MSFLLRLKPVLRAAIRPLGLSSSVRTETHQYYSVFSIFDRLKIMATKLSELFMPPACPGKSLDKSLFQKTITVPALKIEKKHNFQKLLKGGFKSKTIRRRRFNYIRSSSDDIGYMLLDPEQFKRSDDLKPYEEILQNCGVDMKLHDFEVNLTYEDFTADEILRALLPEGTEVPGGFSKIGHIIHLNLKESVLPYKHLIGEVLLDKTQGVRTVINKVDEISNEFRVFKMEVLAGEPEFEAVVKEYGCIYHFDFSKVYWNPRLSTEHERVVNSIKMGPLFDAFAGVGPFAIPAAKKGIQVYANDLNHESYKWLQKNIEVNKVKKKITPFNMDGREFILNVLKDYLLKAAQKTEGETVTDVHVVMNLPASAIEFLDAFRGLLSECEEPFRQNIPKVIVNCHCFSKAADIDEDVRLRVNKVIGSEVPNQDITYVRNVAPNKEMLCSRFEVPLEVLFEGNVKKRENKDDDHIVKKQRVE